MKYNLLYSNQKEENSIRWQDINNPIANTLYSSDADLIRDLKLEIILDAMVDNDISLRKICMNILLHPLTSTSEICMRQEVLQDAILVPEFFQTLYKISIESMKQTEMYEGLDHPGYNKIITSMKKVISYSEIADIYLHHLQEINHLIMSYYQKFSSSRLKCFCDELTSKYSNNFLEELRYILDQLLILKLDTEIVIGGHIGTGLKLTDIKLHTIFNSGCSINTKNKFNNEHLKTIKTLFDWCSKDNNTIPLNNIRLIGNSEEMIDASLIWIVKELSNFTNNCKDLFHEIHDMFGFYYGAVQLYKKAYQIGLKLTMPKLVTENSPIEFYHLSDIGLAMKEGKEVVTNTLTIRNNLCIITGSNQGGKTTFLRSIGLAQLMAQNGLFVAAENYRGTIYKGIFTHFPNEEDKELKHGLLEEELNKLNILVSQMKPGSLLLMNESFSSTIEYDASILAEQITMAFNECDITTLFVTHLFEYSYNLYQKHYSEIDFLRAGRTLDGERTYKLEIGEPLKSSFSMDLYRQLFI